MPTYDYKCDACGHEFEREQRITENPVKECPQCKGEAAKRLISSRGSFALSGSGWFKTGGY
jgi:putative FmdB family regulatory protein